MEPVPTSARHPSLSWANSIQSPRPPPTSWRSILILSSHLRLGLPNGLFPSGFPTNTLCTPLSSRLLSKNIKIKIYRTIILPVVLYGCETWSLTLREEHRLRVFENRVLRRVFGPKRDEVTGEWRKLHNEELNSLYSLPSIVRVALDIRTKILYAFIISPRQATWYAHHLLSDLMCMRQWGFWSSKLVDYYLLACEAQQGSRYQRQTASFIFRSAPFPEKGSRSFIRNVGTQRHISEGRDIDNDIGIYMDKTRVKSDIPPMSYTCTSTSWLLGNVYMVSEQYSFPGWGCQPHAQPQLSWRTNDFLSGLSPLADQSRF